MVSQSLPPLNLVVGLYFTRPKLQIASNTCGAPGSCISSQTKKIDYSLYLLDSHFGLDDGQMAPSLLLEECDKLTA